MARRSRFSGRVASYVVTECLYNTGSACGFEICQTEVSTFLIGLQTLALELASRSEFLTRMPQWPKRSKGLYKCEVCAMHFGSRTRFFYISLQKKNAVSLLVGMHLMHSFASVGIPNARHNYTYFIQINLVGRTTLGRPQWSVQCNINAGCYIVFSVPYIAG